MAKSKKKRVLGRVDPRVATIREACAKDPWFWFTEYVYTRDSQTPDDPVRKFPDYPFLRELIHDLNAKAEDGKPLWPVQPIEKSRQMLISWATTGYATWVCNWHENRDGFLQSQKEKKAWELLDRAEFILAESDKRYPWLNPWEREKSRDMMRITNGSKLAAIPQGGDQLAQYTPAVVVIDETALQDEAENAYLVVVPCLKNGGQLIAPSTPRGANFFWTLCGHNPSQRIPGVHKHRVHYTDHPDYQKEAAQLGGWDAWKTKMMETFGYTEQMWQREMEINYDVALGKAVFSPPFTRQTHVCQLTANPAWDIHEGWDFGYAHPAVVWFQHNQLSNQCIILRELMGADVDLAAFTDEVLETRKQIAPIGRFLSYCDPEGNSHRDTGPKPVEVLREKGIFPRFMKSSVMPGIRLLLRNLTMKAGGIPGTLIDPSCEMLIKGMGGGVVRGEPEHESKTRSEKITWGPFKHVFDALRYAQIHVYRLGAVPQHSKQDQDEGWKGPSWAQRPIATKNVVGL